MIIKFTDYDTATTHEIEGAGNFEIDPVSCAHCVMLTFKDLYDEDGDLGRVHYCYDVEVIVK